MDAEQQELIVEFVAESLDTLDAAEPLLIDLESSEPTDNIAETVNTIFRPFHTMKGGAGFLGLKGIEKVTHTAENLLQLFRKDPEALKPEHAEALTRSCDLIRRMLEKVENQFEDSGFEDESAVIIQQLEQLLAEASGEGAPKPATHIQTFAAPVITPAVQPVAETPPSPTPAESSMPTSTPNPLPAAVSDPAVPLMTQEEALLHLEISPDLSVAFVQEADELLEQAEGAMLVLEKLGTEVDTQEYVQTAFRALHTIKGNAGLMGMSPIERLSHSAENILDRMRDGEIVKPDPIPALLQTVDTLRQALSKISSKQPLDAQAFATTQAMLDKPPVSATAESGNDKNIPAGAPSTLGEILVDMQVTTPEAVQEALDQQSAPLGEIMMKMGTVREEDLQKALTQQSKIKKIQPSSGASSTAPTVQRQDIRVSLEKLDQLINLVGELVITTAMVSHMPGMRGGELERFRKITRQLNKNTRDLQEITMSMRMIPVSTTFRKMIRVVHDVSKKLGKQVQLNIVGEDTEVDKTLVEQISDPLLHIIRNAVDHGIDMPEERQQAGKQTQGSIRLEAKHVGNEVWIIVEDDGRGLNRKKILERAVDKGLVEPDWNPTDEDVWKLLFMPGFSTAEQVTDLSGRGVGMDVVKRNVEKLGGRIDVSSRHGQGSTFILRVPLTLAIIEGMLVRVGKARYVIPVLSVREAFRPRPETITQTMDGTETVRLRQSLLPILRVHELDHLHSDSTELSEGILVVVEEEEHQFCLFVDEVLGQQQIVVKSLPEYLEDVPHLSGCTIMGDGGISLILDIGNLTKTQFIDFN